MAVPYKSPGSLYIQSCPNFKSDSLMFAFCYVYEH